jgi:signal transduction histidine kinase
MAMATSLTTVSFSSPTASPDANHADPTPPPAWLGGGQERSLSHAFAGFAAAAVSLERSYAQLQTEVARLRHELEDRNHRLRESLEENRGMRRHLDQILDGLPCGVLVLEAGGKISLTNPEARRLLGALGGRGAHSDPAAPWVRQWAAGALAAGESEHRCVRSIAASAAGRDEAEVEWIAARAAALPGADGSSSILILRDVSAAKQLEQEREQLRCRQALAEMSALLAHEIRNPLGSLELFCGLLAGEQLEPEARKWVEHMQAGLRLLAATVNNVLHFHNPPSPGRAPTDLGRLLAWLEQFLHPLAQQAGVRLALDQQLDGVEVEGDRHRLEQVLLNLGLNAFRFMPEGGSLKISGRVQPRGRRRSAQVEITDNGCGIDEENLQRIFAPGFTTRRGSPGLGLAVCRTIMQQHGGSIRVSSRPGTGSSFVLEFPLPGRSEGDVAELAPAGTPATAAAGARA